MKVLLVRPKFDEATSYTYAFAGEILNRCQQAGIEVVELAEGDAVKDLVEQELPDMVDVFVHYDHGEEDALIGQDEKAVIDLGNCWLLHRAYVYTLACLSAKSLGVELWKLGAKYWGYKGVVSFTNDALQQFQEAFNCGFKYLFIDEARSEDALSQAKEMFTSLSIELAEAGNTFAAAAMLMDGDYLRCYNANPPESDCLWRRALIKTLGLRWGWAIPSPIKVYKRLLLSRGG